MLFYMLFAIFSGKIYKSKRNYPKVQLYMSFM